MKLFDLHCDTILQAYRKNQNLQTNNLHISFDKAQNYDMYSQIFAIYSDNNLTDDEAYDEFWKIIAHYNLQKETFPSNFISYLAVEGANLLAGDINRLYKIHETGIRFLTLVWGGLSCIGGAHRTGVGLTDFGREVTEKCFEIGIIPDLSHSSEHLFWDVVNIADRYGKPVIATHSNARALCRHSRTLTDEMFTAIQIRGGIVGISMVRGHLSDTDVCNIDTIVSHIEYFLSLGGENTVCIGADLDGTDHLPDEIEDIGDLYKIYNRLLSKNYSEELADNIFYGNAKKFILRNEI